MTNVKSLLYVEIEDEFNKLSEMEKGGEPYKATVDGVTKLMDRAIELEKIDAERKDKDKENLRQDAQAADDRKDRLVKNCLSAAGIVLPVVVTVWGTIKSLKFEEEGTITTVMGRGFINKLLPKK